MLIHITLTEILSSLTLYTIIHSCLWFGRNVEKFAVTEFHRLIVTHKRSGHKGRPESCQTCLPTGMCPELLAVSVQS